MPTYSTPGPIDLAIDLKVGAVEIVATDRADSVVTVAPTNPEKAVDQRGAKETKVDLVGGRLTVVGPRPRISVFGPTESVDVKVELPAGSRVTAEISVGGLRAVGTLGATRVKSSMGAVDLDDTGDLWVRAAHGGVTARTVTGSAEITTDHGQIRVGTITGDAALKASHGSVALGESGGDVEARLSYGDLDITHALGSVAARTAYGTIRLPEVSAGAIDVESGYGAVQVGVRAGVAAWLDLSSKDGHVRNQLVGAPAPGTTEQSVAVRARTRFGDITVENAR